MNDWEISSVRLRGVVQQALDENCEKWFRFVRRVLGNHDDAEDVIHDAVQRVLTRNIPFQSSEDVRKYLGRAISNIANEAYDWKKRERQRRVSLHENSLAAADHADPHDHLERRESSEENERILGLLKEGLARLPEKQYEAVQITLLEPGALSIREAGIERGIPYSTLRHRSLQGIRRLRRYVRKALASSRVRLMLA